MGFLFSTLLVFGYVLLLVPQSKISNIVDSMSYLRFVASVLSTMTVFLKAKNKYKYQ